MKEQIEQYINQNELLKKSRKHVYTYPRFYLYNKLREQGYSLIYIARMFGKNHASVIHGIRTHKNLTLFKDSLYTDLTKEVSNIFDEPEKIHSLSLEVLDCSSLKELKLIKTRIKLGMYENL